MYILWLNILGAKGNLKFAHLFLVFLTQPIWSKEPQGGHPFLEHHPELKSIASER